MELQDKLKILSDAAKYDASCSSSGSNRSNKAGGIGNAAESGICHSWSEDGRCISLLKILYTNYCVYDCAYCLNRISNDVPRAEFTPNELADLTINFYRRNYIEGLFLSSAIVKNPDYTMEQLLNTVKLLRELYRFNGYIHVKAIPGADYRLISETGKYVDRMSVNIELPTSESLKLLAPQKNRDAIIKPMGLINNQIQQTKEERRLFRNKPSFVPAGQSTQLIVGATPESDSRIMRLSENLYQKFSLKRVYYSAYVPVSNSPRLANIQQPPTLREHRLYQADWLLRFYGFSADELLSNENDNLDIDLDPKTDWALKNMQLFPVEINKAPYEVLLRVPGIGVQSANRIIVARRTSPIHFDGMKKIGVVMKRAKYFITCQGKYYSEFDIDSSYLRLSLTEKPQKKGTINGQLSFFDTNALVKVEDQYSKLFGEL